VRSLAVLSRRLDILDHVLAGGKVDERTSTELLHAHLLLLVSRVDSDDLQAHCLCVLLGKGSESTASADNSDSLARLGSRLLQSLVDGDTGAQNWGDGIEGDVLVKASDVSCLGDAVLLEGSVDSVSGEESLSAKRLVCDVG
jgi:hypothetical protein